MLLLLAAVFPERHHAGEQMRAQRKDQSAIVAAVPQRLEPDGARKRIGAAAPVFFRHGHSLNPDLRALAPRFAREVFGAIALDDIVIELCLGELDDAVAQRLLFVGKGKVHQRIALSRW